MPDDAQHPGRGADADDERRVGDPRVTGDHLRRLSGGSHRGDLFLVGVVHDHPASTYRVRSVVGRVDPAVVALELPPLAVALFEQYAADADATGRGRPPRFGGEMSAAVEAADGARVAGIDGPARGFLRELVGSLRREGASWATVRRTGRRVASITRHAVACRLAASLNAHTSLRIEVDAPTPHDAAWADPPERQADDEQSHVRRAASVLSAFQTAPASRCCDRAREAHMAARLEALRGEGDVVAVVGIGHLESVAGRLRDP